MKDKPNEGTVFSYLPLFIANIRTKRVQKKGTFDSIYINFFSFP